MNTVIESVVEAPAPTPGDELIRAMRSLESGNVMRYHAATTVLEKGTVGLHSWGVAVLCLYLTNGKASAALLAGAVMHDSAEMITGDVPFGVKRGSKEVKKLFDDLENIAYENELMPMPELNLQELAILKIADTLEGLSWTAKHEHPKANIVLIRWKQAFAVAVDKFSVLVGPDVIERATLFVNLYGLKHASL
jgi:hypothetical protein